MIQDSRDYDSIVDLLESKREIRDWDMASRSRNSKYQVQLTDSVVKQVDEGGDSGMGTATENSNSFKECDLEKVEKSATKIHLIVRIQVKKSSETPKNMVM